MSFYKLSNLVFIIITSFFLFNCSNITFDKIDNKKNDSINLIKLKKPSTRIEQIFNQTFYSKMANSDLKSKYKLNYEIKSSSSSTLSVKGRASTFNNNEMEINYSLQKISDKQNISSGTIKVNALSGTISSYYTQEKSSQFASERLSKLLAQKVFQKIQIYFYEKKIDENIN